MYHIKKDKRSVQSSQAIYNALMIIAQDKLCKNISITEIVSQAQVGRATFYRNFDCIDDVLRYKLDQNLDQMCEKIKSFYSLSKDPISPSTSTTLKPILQYIYDNSAVYQVLVDNERYDLLRENFIKLIKDFWLSLCEQPNYLPDSVTKNFEYFLEVHASLLIAIITKWIKEDLTILPDDMANIINGINFKTY
ncbi:MAG TPA: hypothetical protein DCY20_02565 [Firmicutes bacterium]|nr:hypothetical protein [Bacillota bacterium]